MSSPVFKPAVWGGSVHTAFECSSVCGPRPWSVREPHPSLVESSFYQFEEVQKPPLSLHHFAPPFHSKIVSSLPHAFGTTLVLQLYLQPSNIIKESQAEKEILLWLHVSLLTVFFLLFSFFLSRESSFIISISCICSFRTGLLAVRLLVFLHLRMS